MHSLSTSEKVRTLKEWQQNPWYGWAMLTLSSAANQASDFVKMPPEGIEGITKREQAIGEVNGLSRFKFEVDSVLATLIELLEEEKKPKEEKEQNED